MSEMLAFQRRFMAEVVSPTAPQDPQPGLQAYRDAYLLRIDEALRTDFAAVHQILGDDDMLALSVDYIEAHPSDNPSIRWVGRSLASFIAESAHWSRVPLLAEIARFEWAKSCLFDAEDAGVATLEDLQAIAPERWGGLRLELTPALCIQQLPGNVPLIWQQLTNEESVATPSAEAEEPWLMWRKELLVHWRSLDGAELAALQAVMAGATFAELCQQLLEFTDEENVPSLAMQLLMQWCHDQIISKLHP